MAGQVRNLARHLGSPAPGRVQPFELVSASRKSPRSPMPRHRRLSYEQFKSVDGRDKPGHVT